MKKKMFWLMAIVGVLVLAAGCSSTSTQVKKDSSTSTELKKDSSMAGAGQDSWSSSDGSRTLGGGRGMVFVDSGALPPIFFLYNKTTLIFLF